MLMKRHSPENPTAAVKRRKRSSCDHAFNIPYLELTLAPTWLLNKASPPPESDKVPKIKPDTADLTMADGSSTTIPFVVIGDHQTSSSSTSDVPAVTSTSVRKVLEKSDVSSLCRLMLRRETVESQILCHWSEQEKAGVHHAEGRPVTVRVYDLDTASFHCMTFKKWGSSKCYVLNNNWSVEFVRRRALNAGDEIGLHWDTCNRRFVFSVLLRKFL